MGKYFSHGVLRILTLFVVEGRTFFICGFFFILVFLSLLSVYVAVVLTTPRKPKILLHCGRK